MTPPLTALPIVPENLAHLRARMSIERPLHWNEARRLLAALEAAWVELGWVEAVAGAQGARPSEVEAEALSRTEARPSRPAPHGATRS